MSVVFKGRLTGHKQFHANNDGIKFRFAIATQEGEMEVFADSYTTGSDEEKSRTVAGMTRRRLKILGLDMDKCSADDWTAAMTPGPDGWCTALNGAECDLEQKIDSFGTKYDILTNQSLDERQSLAMFAALQAAKGPRTAPPPPPPPQQHAVQAPAAPARPSMAAPAVPKAPRPQAAPPVPAAPVPAAPKPAGSSII